MIHGAIPHRVGAVEEGAWGLRGESTGCSAGDPGGGGTAPAGVPEASVCEPPDVLHRVISLKATGVSITTRSGCTSVSVKPSRLAPSAVQDDGWPFTESSAIELRGDMAIPSRRTLGSVAAPGPALKTKRGAAIASESEWPASRIVLGVSDRLTDSRASRRSSGRIAVPGPSVANQASDASTTPAGAATRTMGARRLSNRCVHKG